MSGPKTAAVRFPDGGFEPVEVPVGADLSEHLDATNSPVLFGCRTGICGTCACLLEGAAEPPGEDEAEVVAVWAPGDPRARLACQVVTTGDITLRPLPDPG